LAYGSLIILIDGAQQRFNL